MNLADSEKQLSKFLLFVINQRTFQWRIKSFLFEYATVVNYFFMFKIICMAFCNISCAVQDVKISQTNFVLPLS